MNTKSSYISQGALIAALYVLLTLVSSAFGLSSGAIQLRLSEMLTVLPLYFSSAVPGLFIGCIIANLITGSAIWDVVFGSLATLVAAIITSKMQKARYLASLPPVLANTLVVPFVIKLVYGDTMALWLIAITVFIGEILSCTVLGTILITFMEKRKK